MQIRNGIAIVTGTSAGIGLAVARLLAEKGAKGVLAARSAEKLKQLEREISGSFAVPTDMSRMTFAVSFSKPRRNSDGSIS